MTDTFLEFQSGDNLLQTLAFRQSGSLEKGIVEAIMNCFDSKSTIIDIELTSTHFKITDNGHGFATEQHVDEYFRLLGFDHSKGLHADEERFSKFGLGRFQLICFGKISWRSHEFEMTTDILENPNEAGFMKTKGLEKVDGCICSGELYTPLTNHEVHRIVNTIKMMVAYIGVVVRINGENVEKFITDFDYEDDDIQILFEKSLHAPVKIYNKGVFVNSNSSNVMHGAIVITKKSLVLNTARDDVIKNKCPIWKKIYSVLKAELNKDLIGRSDNSFTKAEGLEVLKQIISNEFNHLDSKERRLLTYKAIIPTAKGLKSIYSLLSAKYIGLIDTKVHKFKDVKLVQDRNFILLDVNTPQLVGCKDLDLMIMSLLKFPATKHESINLLNIEETQTKIEELREQFQIETDFKKNADNLTPLAKIPFRKSIMVVGTELSEMSYIHQPNGTVKAMIGIADLEEMATCGMGGLIKINALENMNSILSEDSGLRIVDPRNTPYLITHIGSGLIDYLSKNTDSLGKLAS